MDDAPRSWTTTGLADALRGPDFADELSVERIEQAEPVLKLTMHHFGDLAIFASVAGEQIIVSSLLWPVDEQAEPDAFNRFLLKTQKLVPLSNFAIAEVGGREYYELVGELSVESSLHTVLIELRVLAQNAIEAASELRTEFAA